MSTKQTDQTYPGTAHYDTAIEEKAFRDGWQASQDIRQAADALCEAISRPVPDDETPIQVPAFLIRNLRKTLASV